MEVHELTPWLRLLLAPWPALTSPKALQEGPAPELTEVGQPHYCISTQRHRRPKITGGRGEALTVC